MRTAWQPVHYSIILTSLGDQMINNSLGVFVIFMDFVAL